MLQRFLDPATLAWVIRSLEARPEVQAAIKAAIAETGAASMKDMGKVVAVLKAKFTGQMDFAKASALVKAALNG